MSFFSKFMRKSLINNDKTPLKTILEQMNEPRPLPMGVKEFEVWSNRILSGAMIPSDDPESLKAVLASMIMALGPLEDHKPDSYFIHILRKAAANEVANATFRGMKEKKEAARKLEEADANRKNG